MPLPRRCCCCWWCEKRGAADRRRSWRGASAPGARRCARRVRSGGTASALPADRAGTDAWPREALGPKEQHARFPPPHGMAAGPTDIPVRGRGPPAAPLWLIGAMLESDAQPLAAVAAVATNQKRSLKERETC